MSGRRFVVLDRDGTIIEERNYLSDPAQVKLIPGAAAALRDLRRLGFGLVVITNQSGIGRGFFDETRLGQVHERIRELLRPEDIWFDGLYVCPHTPEDNCECRKPRVGLMRKAAQELSFELSESIVVGDKASDIEMGRQVGALTFLVRTGYGEKFAAEGALSVDHIVDDLAGVARIVAALDGVAGRLFDDH